MTVPLEGWKEGRKGGNENGTSRLALRSGAARQVWSENKEQIHTRKRAKTVSVKDEAKRVRQNRV